MIDYTTWAESLCDPENARLLFQHPHALAGTDLAFTTNGVIALFLLENAWDRPLDTHNGDRLRLLAMLFDPLHRYATTLGAILDWTGEPVPRRCDCDGKDSATCQECQDGLLPPFARPAPLLVGGPTLDLNLVHKLLHACPDPLETPVEVGWNDGYGDPVVFRAAGWTGFVMPTREVSLFDEKPLIGSDWDNSLGGR